MSSENIVRKGPLVGLRVIEFAAIGPVPHAAMLFADLGADVLRIDRAGGNGWPNPIVDRGRGTLVADLRTPDGVATALAAVDKADVVLEGFRPGVMERFGLGPDVLQAHNPQLVFARMTGWGQTGPLAKSAGHDINYIALAGALAAIGSQDDSPIPPLNLVGDFGGGSLFLVFGVMAALWERERSGLGQVVDAAIIDGVTSLMTMFAGLVPQGFISMQRGRNLLGGAAPFYRCYKCADGKEIAIGALEPQFYSELLDHMGVMDDLRDNQNDEQNWDERTVRFAEVFASKPRHEWCEILEKSDACFAPVLTLQESIDHPHMAIRQTYVDAFGLRQAAPAPRFSRTQGEIAPNIDGEQMLRHWGVEAY